jgi:hypothetical protein
VARFHSRVAKVEGRREIPAHLVPTDAERAVLVTRSDALAAALLRGGRDDLETVLAALLSVFPRRDSADATSGRMTVLMYASAVERFPLWVVREVCRKVLEGRAGVAPTFAPSPAELSTLCQREVEPAWEELGKIKDVLAAVPYSVPDDAARARIAEGLTQLAADLRGASDPHPKRFTAPKRPVETTAEVIARLNSITVEEAQARLDAVPDAGGRAWANGMAEAGEKRRERMAEEPASAPASGDVG